MAMGEEHQLHVPGSLGNDNDNDNDAVVHRHGSGRVRGVPV